jgi:hypothetical protein
LFRFVSFCIVLFQLCFVNRYMFLEADPRERWCGGDASTSSGARETSATAAPPVDPSAGSGPLARLRPTALAKAQDDRLLLRIHGTEKEMDREGARKRTIGEGEGKEAASSSKRAATSGALRYAVHYATRYDTCYILCYTVRYTLHYTLQATRCATRYTTRYATCYTIEHGCGMVLTTNSPRQMNLVPLLRCNLREEFRILGFRVLRV